MRAAGSCKCGAAVASVRLVTTHASSRGVATRVEAPECTRCADRTAFRILATSSAPITARRCGIEAAVGVTAGEEEEL